MTGVSHVAIIGAGPGGYEAALVGRQLGAEVTLVHRGVGGSAVLTDCVPSKALVATAGAVTEVTDSAVVGVRIRGAAPSAAGISVDLAAVNARIRDMARTQSTDIAAQLDACGVHLVEGFARFTGTAQLAVAHAHGDSESIDADVILIASGARPRTITDAEPDGERILTWEQLYTLPTLPEHLIVVGSGVTGAEFASAYRALGCEVTLVSSRDRVLPGEDSDAARVIEAVFAQRGITVLARARAAAAHRTTGGVTVKLTDGRTIEGSHVLMAVGSLPNTNDIGLDIAGVAVDERGFIVTDRVSRTNVRGIYAAGDVTGVQMLASVAAMQGRIAMWHALGDAVTPLEVEHVSSTVFTAPEIATVGLSQTQLDSGDARADVYLMPLATNARAKMEVIEHGFIKIICRRTSRIIAGAVVVSPHASELIHPLTIAVEQRLTVDQLAQTFTVYPSLSGSIAEAARRLHLAAG
jgi:dihydrolipoamide dehydrogenase